MATLPEWALLALRVAVVVGVVASLLVAWWFDRSDRPGDRLRRRFLLGVPWGSLLAATGIVAFYLFVQNGWTHWFHPLQVPFVSWSYLYPLGTLTGPFAHAGPGHLIGNLVGTLALAPVAEYVWGHYPRERGAGTFGPFRTSPLQWLRTNPFARAFVVFPAAVVGVGLLTGLVGWGPGIGFSGVVYAFGGFALVRYPILTVVALASREVVGTAYRALADPVITGSASSSFGPPWWAGIHVQAHALGLLLGVLAGLVLLYRRDERPSALRLWVGALVYAVSLSLWAIWWYRGADAYVLYRGPGLLVVVGLAALLVAAAVASDRPLLGDFSRRQTAALVVALPVVLMAGVAVPVNLTTVADGGDDYGPGVSVRGYHVVYAEDVPNRMVSAVNVSAFGESTQLRTSGVIVVNTNRHLWWRAASKGRLAHAGRQAVPVGGLGWRRVVVANRTGWSAAGGGAAYRVRLRVRGGPSTVAYTSDPATARPVVAGRNVSVAPVAGGFNVSVARNNTTLASVPIPARNETVAVGGITLVREESNLVATANGTRVRVASKESYN